MKKIIKGLRDWTSSIDQDVKDHLFVIAIYFFVVVQWGLSVSEQAAMYAIYVGFGLAISWEALNAKYSDKKFSIWASGKDLAVYIVFAVLYIVALKN